MNLPVVGQDTAIPAREALVARARAIAPMIGAARDEANRLRDISPEIIAEIDRAGLFKILKPRDFGGYEMDPRVFYEVQNIFAEECTSTAWVYGVLSIQVFMLALFDRQAQREVWGDGSETVLVSSSFMPKGSAEPVDGGYRIRGQWPFSSGSTHCSWALIGSLLPSAEADQPPEMRVFLVPRSDYLLVDTWQTFGLRATGSNDIRVEDAFVPAYRTWQPTVGLTVEPGGTVPPLYRLPWMYMFPSCISNLSIGAGRGAIRAFVDGRRRQPPRPGFFSDDAAPLAIAHAREVIEGAKIMIDHHLDVMLGHIAADTAMPVADALLFRRQLATVTRRITAAIDELMLMTGGRGVYDDGPLTQTWLDLCAARHHPGNTPDAISLTLGKDTLDQTA
jgi:3-hydroxy-9,10-secoandrosta-1,3,5(10)-triene-9,17-dione monooxygenase